MYRLFIVEDEAPALQRLMNLVQEYDRDLEIAGTSGSVRQAVKWLQSHPQPDLLLMDIQLNDGLSTEVLEQCSVDCPVIFVTAYDSFIIQAFEYHCIDYVLKPVKQERLHKALAKYFEMKAHFEGKLSGLAQSLSGTSSKPFTGRILAQKGVDQFSLKAEDVAYFYTEHKVVFAIDGEGQRYLVEKTLGALEEQLRPGSFFRVNRKYLVSLGGIHSFRSFGKGRLELMLKPAVEESVIISQPNASSFKSWAAD